MLRDFELEMPANLQETLSSLPGGTPLAGGTNLLVDLRSRREAADRLIWLGNIDNFRDIKIEDEQVTIGGGTTVGDIFRHPKMETAAPSLIDCARVFGGQMVRNRATLAGNICSSSPAADAVPPLLSLDAKLYLASATNVRTIALDDFYTGFKKNRRSEDELVIALSWPVPAANTANRFYKLARRKGDAITVAGVAVTVTRNGDTCTDARIALGAIAPTVFRAKDAEALLKDCVLTEERIDAAARKAMDQAEPIDDLRASADYRRDMVGVLTRRLLHQAWQSLSEKATGQ